MNHTFRPALLLFLLMTVVTGVAYPLVITAIAKVLFPTQTAGSLVTEDGKPIGSTLIGQNFSDAKHVWGRPSATAPYAYNAIASSGSNLGPLNPALTDAVKQRINALRAADPQNTAKVPVDLVTASASGLDPEISIAGALYQASRVARVRGIDKSKVESLIQAHAHYPVLGFLGEPRINVLELNLALDVAR